MGPLDALRRVEQHIQEEARRGAELAKSGLQDVEGRVRRRMHLPPRNLPKGRTGIVSVNGQDVEKIICMGGKKPV